MHEETELAIWDLFFIKGSTVIFSVTITILELMQDEILNCQEFGDFFIVMDTYPKTISRSALLKCLVSGITNREIKDLRAMFREETMQLVKQTWLSEITPSQHTRNPKYQFI